MLSAMNRNAEQLRLSYGAEVQLHYGYSDLLLNNCPNMMFLFNEKLLLVNYSSSCLPLLTSGEKQDRIGMALDQIFSPAVDEAWVQKVRELNEQVLESREPFAYDDTISFTNDAFFHAHIAISPIADDQGACRGTVMSLNDITELIHAKQKAEGAARSKSSFLANMSHEIRTPMNAVKGLSELLALTELNDLQRNYVQHIVSASNSLLGIINDVLDFAKIDANRVEFIEGPYNLPELIAGVCNVVNSRADSKKLLMFIEANPNLPLRLLGDDVRIKQVLVNLLSNAVKYTNEGSIILRLDMERRNGSDCLVFHVEDTGIGIREEDQAILFDAFSRADLRKNRNVTGTGLGLAISKQLAVAMGGDISVQSVHGKGSIFTFWLPQQIVDASPLAKVEEAERKNVLVVEQKPYITHALRSLEQLGVSYRCVKDVQDAAKLDLARFTHCVIDDNLPQLNDLRREMPDCRFAVMRNMNYAMDLSDHHDDILYLPVFVTDLARFLNRTGNQRRESLTTAEAIDEFTVRNATILVVDDNEINRIVAGEMLSSFEADVICAQSGEEALMLCEDQVFDMIFMDHMMPGLDGVETTIQIREKSTLNAKTPIVALTANVVNDMKSYYLKNGMDDFLGKPVDLCGLGQVLRRWLPNEKVVEKAPLSLRREDADAAKNAIHIEQLLAEMDNFGLYSSDVMRELNGNFDVYIQRMEAADKSLGNLVDKLKAQVSQGDWIDFTDDCMALYELLYGIGARDCAGRSRKLALAAKNENIAYIHEDFFSLMGNMYMLGKKLNVLAVVARGESRDKMPLNIPQYLHGCLEKMARALRDGNSVEAMFQLENAASFSLNMDLDMALKEIKAALERGNFDHALARLTEISRQYATNYHLADDEELMALS